MAGRECGGCTICCKVLPVNSAGLKKTANSPCPHCREGQGCQIYETRPVVCRGFYCEWRLNGVIPATWRPDRSGIFIERIAPEHIDHLGQRYSRDYAVAVMLVRPDAIERPALVEILMQYVLRRVAVFLAIPGPEGFLPAQFFINDALESAATERQPEAIIRVLRQAYEALLRDRFEPAPGFG